MNPADLAGMLELMAQALRLLPAGGVAPAAQLPPAVNRTFGEWLDDRGLSAKNWKRVALMP